jgi:hypothetical protein
MYISELIFTSYIVLTLDEFENCTHQKNLNVNYYFQENIYRINLNYS